jgi:hypothetical protein
VAGVIVTLPRQVLPGSFYKITRRCTQRQFLLRPDDVTNNVFAYCLGEGVIRTGVDPSCHEHVGVVVTDVEKTGVGVIRTGVDLCDPDSRADDERPGMSGSPAGVSGLPDGRDGRSQS